MTREEAIRKTHDSLIGRSCSTYLEAEVLTAHIFDCGVKWAQEQANKPNTVTKWLWVVDSVLLPCGPGTGPTLFTELEAELRFHGGAVKIPGSAVEVPI